MSVMDKVIVYLFSKPKRVISNSLNNSEPKENTVNQIDILELKCPNIYSPVKHLMEKETEDDNYVSVYLIYLSYIFHLLIVYRYYFIILRINN